MLQYRTYAQIWYVRYGSYAEYLRLTTIFFAEIAYVEAPTPRVFGQLSAETHRFTPDTML
jgi:hypothetical protein